MSPIAKIESWLERRGFSMEPGASYACYFDEHKVTYRAQDAQATQVRGLLHECGHVLVSLAIKRHALTPRFKRGYPSERMAGARTNVSAADVLHEEIEAWHRGYLLSRRLGIRLDVGAYWKDYGFCIKRYCRQILKRAV